MPEDSVTLEADVQETPEIPHSSPMKNTPGPDGKSSGYWYDSGTSHPSAIDLLNLLREYRDAERDMRQRTQDSMRMGETDLVALRFLVRKRASGVVVRQRDLGAALKISAPAVTALVDRLVRDGYVQRVPHPDDRRSVAIEILAETDREIRETLSSMHSTMLAAAEGLNDQERAGAAKFLQGLIKSVRESHG